jgi:hypothetical protein
MLMAEKVECYSGSVYPERPTALYWQGQRLEIEKVQQAWQTPQGRHFRVQTVGLRLTHFEEKGSGIGVCNSENVQVFELVYQQAEDDWLISHISGS